jgi:hypothetical protein
MFLRVDGGHDVDGDDFTLNDFCAQPFRIREVKKIGMIGTFAVAAK